MSPITWNRNAKHQVEPGRTADRRQTDGRQIQDGRQRTADRTAVRDNDVPDNDLLDDEVLRHHTGHGASDPIA